MSTTYIEEYPHLTVAMVGSIVTCYTFITDLSPVT